MVLMKGRHIYIMSMLILLVCSSLPTIVLSESFSFEDPQLLLNNTSSRDRIKMWQNTTYTEWFVNYVKSSDKLLYINIFDNAFISQSSTTKNCGDASGCINSDCNYVGGTPQGNLIECIAQQDDVQGTGKIYRYFVGNGTFFEMATGVDVTTNYYVVEPATVNDYFVSGSYSLKMWFKQASANDPRYTITNTLQNNFDGDGSITLPILYQDPSDMQIAYCRGYYHIFVIKAVGGQSVMTDLVYTIHPTFKIPQTNIQTYPLTPSGWNIDDDDFNVLVKNNSLYIVMVNRTTPTPLIFYQKYSCNLDGSISLSIPTETHNQTEIEPTINMTANVYIKKPYLTKDASGTLYLLYEFVNNTYSQVKVASEVGACVCSPFHATGECDGSNEMFNRTCSPSLCNTTVQWTMTDTCIAGETCTPNWECYNATAKAYKQLDCTFANVTDCTGLTPYCYGGVCVGECAEGYYCVDGETRAFSTANCQVSEILNCNSTGDGYCDNGRCQTIMTPAFNESDTTLDIIEQITGGVRGMLSWLAKPTFVILMAIAITILIVGIFSLLGSLAEKSTRGGR